MFVNKKRKFGLFLLIVAMVFACFLVPVTFGVETPRDTSKALVFKVTPENYKQYYPKIGVALGGGAAKGLAHIGVLQVFEEEHIPVHALAGTSMGSIIASLYACGYTLEDIQLFFKEIDQEEIFDDMLRDKPARFLRGSLNTPAFIRFPNEDLVGINSGSNGLALMSKWTLAKDFKAHFKFDDLPTPLRIVATDFLTGEKVVFKDGSISRAVRASTSIPYIFKPLKYKETYLVDGAVSEVVPIDEIVDMQADIVIGVNVAKLAPIDRTKATSLVQYSQHLFDLLNSAAMNKNFKNADVLIDVEPTASITATDYEKINEIIELGRSYARAAMPLIKKKIAEETYTQEKFIIKEIKFEGVSPTTELFEIDLAYSHFEIVQRVYPLLKKHAVKEATVYLIPQAEAYTLKVVCTAAETITEISLQGNTLELPQSLLKKIEVFRERVYAPKTVHALEEEIAHYYRDKGYTLVELNSSFNKGTLEITIHEIPIKQVSIKGNRYTSSEVIESFLKFSASEIYNANKVQQAVQQMYATELFEQVETEVRRLDDGVHLRFHLTERPFGLFYANAQYFSSQDKVELNFGHRNNYNFGYRVKSYVHFATGPQNDMNAGVGSYDIFNTGMGWGLDYHRHLEDISLYNKKELDKTFFDDREENRMFLEYWFLNYSIASFGLKKRRQYVLDAVKKDYEGYHALLYTTELAFKWDTLDKDFLADKGGNVLLFSERNDLLPYEKTSLSSILAFQLKKKVSLNLRNYIGVSHGDVMEFDRFMLRKKWLPYGFVDYAAQGDNIAYSRLSCRFPIMKHMRGEVGVDIFRSWRDRAGTISHFENTGGALALHYPSFIGLASFAYTVRNDGNSVWLLNLSNEFEN